MIFPGVERLILQGRIWLQDAYFKIKKIAATEFTSEPPGTTTPEADHIYVYAKDSVANPGVVSPWWKDEAGDEHEVGDAASSYTDEQAQDAVGGILTDSSSVDFTYDDGAPSITAAVLPAGVDHNSLANLTTGDPHTQYVLRSILTTNGDLFVRLAGVIARLGVGSEGQILTVTSSLPAWANAPETGGHILLSDTRSTPFGFNDLLQMDDGSDFMWTDPS